LGTPHLSMGRKINRLLLLVLTCGVVGVVLGGTTSRASMNQCLAAENPTNDCLTQNPMTKMIDGMSVGLVAGAGAAIGATWQTWKKDS
jgi:hypothetical protein